MPGGPGQPQCAPTFRGRFPHTGHRAMSRGAAYLWLPPHWGSSRGGAGAEATRRRAPSRASLQAGVRVRVSVRVCAGGGGTNKEPSKHGESVSSKAHKYSSRVLISPTHTRARRNTARAPAASRPSHNRQTTFANCEGSVPGWARSRRLGTGLFMHPVPWAALGGSPLRVPELCKRDSGREDATLGSHEPWICKQCWIARERGEGDPRVPSLPRDMLQEGACFQHP